MWTSFKEGLPEFGIPVLILFQGSRHIEDATIHPAPDGEGWVYTLFDGESLNDMPTHWMPRPADPVPQGGAHTMDDIARRLQEADVCMQLGADGLLVRDYISLTISPNAGPWTYEGMAECAKQLKAVAQACNFTIVLPGCSHNQEES